MALLCLWRVSTVHNHELRWCAGDMNLAGLEVPAAAVRTNADGDVINLEIDISVLDAIPEGAIKARKLLGPQYGFTPSRNAIPADLDMKKLLTLSEYKRRRG